MGFVSTFCPISGCSPIAADALEEDEGIQDATLRQNDEGDDHTTLRKAIQQLVSELNGKASELTVIGIIDDGGSPVFELDIDDVNELYVTRDQNLRIVSGCVADGMFEFGAVEHRTLLDSNDRAQNYLVSYGGQIMVLSWALPILYLATDFRMNAQRIWDLAIKFGHNVPQNFPVFPGVDYGAVEKGIDQFLNPLVNWDGGTGETVSRLKRLEQEAATVQQIKQAVTHEGGFWVWMAADNFPLETSLNPSQATLEFKSSPPPASPPRNWTQRLSFDVLSHLASYLPLPSLLSLASSSRSLREILLGSTSSRSQTLRKWLTNEGKYWLPLEVDLGIAESEVGAVPRVNDLPEPKVKALGLRDQGDDWWQYVKRCISSGSMRNRKRIWGIATQLEERANEMGV